MSDTDAIRQQLESWRTELLSRANRIDAHLHRDEPVPADFAEQATELENLDVLFALDREGKQKLAQINSALERIENGEYGDCLRCGESIEPGRLQALPTAETCAQCAGLTANKP